MQLLTQCVIGFVAFLHLYFLYLEMFAWTTRAPKVFRGFSPDFFEKTKALAANQGIYNGFLAAGLIWGFFINDHAWNIYVWIFFLSCVLVASIVGAITVDKKIFFIQGIPALIGLILVHL